MENKCQDIPFFPNLYSAENPATYFLVPPPFPMILCARIMERREKNMVRHALFQNLYTK
jgi:hypothetical protein